MSEIPINPDIVSHVPSAEELAAAHGEFNPDTIKPAQHRMILRGMGIDVPEPVARELSQNRLQTQPLARPETNDAESYEVPEVHKTTSAAEMQRLRAQIAAEAPPADSVQAQNMAVEQAAVRPDKQIQYDSKREMDRQMGIAAADRANRQAAGLPPRVHNLR